LECAIGLGQSRRTGLLGVTQVPEPTAADHRGQGRRGGETRRVLLSGQAIDRERAPTSGEHRDQPLVTHGTHQAIERHRRDRVEHRAQLPTEAAVGGQQRITGYGRAPLAIAQDDMREHGEHRCARRARYPPDGHPAQTNAPIVGVAGQAPTAATRRLVLNLKAQRPHDGEDTREKRLAIAQQLKVRCFVSTSDGDGPVFTGLAGGVSPGPPQVTWAMQGMTKDEDKAAQFQEDRGGGTLPLNPMECGKPRIKLPLTEEAPLSTVLSTC
jgi:hypothetical protein